MAEIEGPDPKKWLTGAMRLFNMIPTMYDTTGSDKNSQIQKLKPLKRAQMTSWWGIRPVLVGTRQPGIRILSTAVRTGEKQKMVAF